MKKILIFVLAWMVVFSAAAHALDVQEVVGKKSGVKAWLVEDHKLPIIALRLAFQGGSEQDAADKQGLAVLTMDALTQGAGPYGAAAFQQQLADRSISMAFSAGRDELEGGVKCLTADKAVAFELLRLALTRPRFESWDIERLRAQQLSGIRHQFSDPKWQARFALYSQIFAGHPYSQRRLGTTETLKALTRDDVKDFAARHLARDTVTVAVAGDISAEALAEALDRIFMGLPAKAQLNAVSDVPDFGETPSVLVRREGTQTDLLFALSGPKRDDPDYYAVEIANYILGGGGFSSKLMQELRDSKGLTYGISTDVAPSQHVGLILGHAAVANAKTGEALDVIRSTMRRLYGEEPSVRDVDAAKDFLTGSMPLALTSTEKIAALLVAMQRENLGRDYLDRYNGLIRGVTAADIARVLERYFNPDKMALVAVGKPEGAVFSITRDLAKE